MNLKNILIGALSGLLSAILIDLHAWSKADYGTPFDWRLGVGRWLAGAAAGISTAWSLP